jgi:hypothetical protein
LIASLNMMIHYSLPISQAKAKNSLLTIPIF